MNYIRSFGKFADVSENLKYHIDNGISILENIFRPNSLSYYELILLPDLQAAGSAGELPSVILRSAC